MSITIIFLLVTLGLIFVLSRHVISKPGKLLLKVSLNSLLGMLILWMVNFAGSYVDINIPLNLFTVVVTGFLGIPGLAMLGILRFIVN